MIDQLAKAKLRLMPIFDRCTQIDYEPVCADPWVVSSLLQKSIRRGEKKIAERAAHTLFALKGSAIWRRYMVIAFEDIGVGAIDEVEATVAAASDATWRKKLGGSAFVAVAIAGMMAEAAKERSSDYLVSAQDHPTLFHSWQEISSSTKDQCFGRLSDPHSSIFERAMVIRSICGITNYGISGMTPDLRMLIETWRSLGVPDELVTATEIAARATREPITMMVPMIWLAANKEQHTTVAKFPVPPSPIIDSISLYALDMHTRLGREAIWRFARENEAVCDCLKQFVPANRWRDAAYNAAYYVDAAPVSKRLVWNGSEEAEKFGVERDSIAAGVPLEGISPLIQTIRDNLPHLNSIRAEVFRRSRSTISVSSSSTEVLL